MAAKVVIVGVGMVGETIISVLKERNPDMEWPPRVCATHERTETLAGEAFRVEAISDKVFTDADVVLFAGNEGLPMRLVRHQKALIA